MDVLIAGAGPTGLTLAIELARRGVAVRIIDKAETFFIGLARRRPPAPHAGGLRGPRRARRGARGRQPRRLPMKIHVGGEVVGERMMFDPVEPTPTMPYPTGWFLGQSQTEGILRDRLAEFGVRVELDTALTGFEQDADGVTATLSTGETVRAAYLVGADGGKSFVRKTLGIAFEGTTDESIRMLLGDVHADGLDRALRALVRRRRTDPMRGMMFSPLPGTPVVPVRRAARATASSTSRRRCPRSRPGSTRCAGGGIQLSDLAWSTVWRPNVRLAARFRDGRVFLAGDAAHVHPPTGGQGLNTGVQDGYNLGWKLADGSPELIDSYEAERRTNAARVLGISTGAAAEVRRRRRGRAQARRGHPAAGHQLPRRPAVPGRDRRAAARRPRPGRAAGRRQRQARSGCSSCSAARTRRCWSSATARRLRGAHRILPAGSVATGTDLVDDGGHAYAAYEAEGTVVVRPDGYVGVGGGGVS